MKKLCLQALAGVQTTEGRGSWGPVREDADLEGEPWGTKGLSSQTGRKESVKMGTERRWDATMVPSRRPVEGPRGL